MAAPLLAIAKIVCDQFEALRPLGQILSGETAAEPSSGQPTATVPQPSSAAA
jgi:hypothetical protein